MKSGWVGKITNNVEETIKLGVQFSSYIETGDVYVFIGELASGKTTFIKGILEGLKYKGEVTSPTFTLVNEYEAEYPIIHIDCYREDQLHRWIKLGMNDYMDEGNVVIIEWGDKIESLLPYNSKKIFFSHINENSREIIIKNQ